MASVGKELLNLISASLEVEDQSDKTTPEYAAAKKRLEDTFEEKLNAMIDVRIGKGIHEEHRNQARGMAGMV